MSIPKPLPAGLPLPPPKNGAAKGLPPLAGNAPVSIKEPTIKTGGGARAQKIVLYGTGGIGKTSLAALAPNAIIVDPDHGADHTGVPYIDDIGSYDDLCGIMNSTAIREYSTIVIDSATQVCELLSDRILATVPMEKGGRAKNLEDYGYGKGYVHLYEHFLQFLQGLDAVVRRGQNIIIVAHDCTGSVPNPGGDDWLRYEPRVWQSKNGNNSLRQRLKEWADHLLFIGYDVNVKDGKASSSGSRTVYPQEQAAFMAKSRLMRDPWVFNEGDGTIWTQHLGLTDGGKSNQTGEQ